MRFDGVLLKRDRTWYNPIVPSFRLNTLRPGPSDLGFFRFLDPLPGPVQVSRFAAGWFAASSSALLTPCLLGVFLRARLSLLTSPR